MKQGNACDFFDAEKRIIKIAKDMIGENVIVSHKK